MARINPIVVDPVGNGLQDAASNSLVKHRSRGLPNGQVQSGAGRGSGKKVGAATKIKGGVY